MHDDVGLRPAVRQGFQGFELQSILDNIQLLPASYCSHVPLPLNLGSSTAMWFPLLSVALFVSVQWR